MKPDGAGEPGRATASQARPRPIGSDARSLPPRRRRYRNHAVRPCRPLVAANSAGASADRSIDPARAPAHPTEVHRNGRTACALNPRYESSTDERRRVAIRLSSRTMPGKRRIASSASTALSVPTAKNLDSGRPSAIVRTTSTSQPDTAVSFGILIIPVLPDLTDGDVQ